MSSVEILLSILVAGLVLLLILTRRGARHVVKGEEIERLRQEVRETVALNQTVFSGQLQQVGELLKNQLDSLTSQVGEQLKTSLEASARSSGRIDERLDQATRVIGEVRQSLGRLSEANQRIYEIGRDIASLQEILRSPKLRGGLGELLLGDLLSEILPQERFSLQYAFKGGETVDAIIRLAEHLVPVDAKFPLEGFVRLREAGSEEERLRLKRELIRTVRAHIDAIASKYIRPSEGTLDFALMYIPAENVYYEVITREERLPEDYNLFAYATSRRVVPVSPNSLFAYLQTILLGLHGLQLAENITVVLGRLGELQAAFDQVDSDLQLVGKHLRHSLSRFQAAEAHLQAFRGQLSLLTQVDAKDAVSPPMTNE